MIQGSLRSREYQKDGISHRISELRADAIAKLDRAERRQIRRICGELTENMRTASMARFSCSRL